MIRYTNGLNIPNLINRVLYLLINGLFVLLISVIILRNDIALINYSQLTQLSLLQGGASQPAVSLASAACQDVVGLFIVIYSYLLSFSFASL